MKVIVPSTHVGRTTQKSPFASDFSFVLCLNLVCEPYKSQSEPILLSTSAYLQQLSFPQSAELLRLSNKF